MSDRVEGNRHCLKGIQMDSESNLWKGNIPIDLVNDILLRLPAKAIGRCMCTCKKWYSLVKSAEFITSHLNHSKLKDHGLLIVQEGCYSIFSESDSILIEQESGQIPFTVMERDLYILGSCRGLVLVRLKVECGWLVLLWNPLLEKFKVIDTIIFERPHGNARNVSSWLCVFALGFHEASNDYRVVRMDRTSSNIFPEVDVYSFTKDSWHRVKGTLTNGKILPIIKSPWKMVNYVNGVVHWLAMYDMQEHEEENDRFVIMSFDFDIEVFKLIELPRRYGYYNYESHTLELNELNGKLVLFGVYPDDPGESYYTWVMMNYPLVESWTCIGCLFEHKVKYRKHDIWPMVCTKKENCMFKHIQFEKRDMLRYYNAKEDEIYELEVLAPYKCPVIVDFVDCLILLDTENDVLDDHHTP